MRKLRRQALLLVFLAAVLLVPFFPLVAFGTIPTTGYINGQRYVHYDGFEAGSPAGFWSWVYSFQGVTQNPSYVCNGSYGMLMNPYTSPYYGAGYYPAENGWGNQTYNIWFKPNSIVTINNGSLSTPFLQLEGDAYRWGVSTFFRVINGQPVLALYVWKSAIYGNVNSTYYAIGTALSTTTWHNFTLQTIVQGNGTQDVLAQSSTTTTWNLIGNLYVDESLYASKAIVVTDTYGGYNVPLRLTGFSGLAIDDFGQLAPNPVLSVSSNLDGIKTPHFTVNGTSSYTSPRTITPDAGYSTINATDLSFRYNATTSYVFSYWLVNSSLPFYTRDITLNFTYDTTLTMYYVLYSPFETEITPSPQPSATAATGNQVWYLRSDTHTINSELGYKMQTQNSYSIANVSGTPLLAGQGNLGSAGTLITVDPSTYFIYPDGSMLHFSNNQTFDAISYDSDSSLYSFDNYSAFISGCNITIENWVTSTHLSYTIDDLAPSGYQLFANVTEPITVTLDGVPAQRGDGWNYDSALGLAVYGATYAVNIQWSGIGYAVSWGVRVWAFDVFNSSTELTNGVPAICLTSLDNMTAPAYLTGSWVSPADVPFVVSHVEVILYLSTTSGWETKGIWETNPKLYIKLPQSEWQFTISVQTVQYDNGTFSTVFFGDGRTANTRIRLAAPVAEPWEVSLAKMQTGDYTGAALEPWTWIFGDATWLIFLAIGVTWIYLRHGSLKMIILLLYLLGGSGSILWGIFASSGFDLSIAGLMLGVAIGLTLLRIIHK